MSTKNIEEEFFQKFSEGKNNECWRITDEYEPTHVQVDPMDVANWLRTTLTTLTQHHQAEVERAVEDIIKMADALELECGKDGDKGTKQWMAFKGFRNAVRDKYLTPTKTDKQ